MRLFDPAFMHPLPVRPLLLDFGDQYQSGVSLVIVLEKPDYATVRDDGSGKEGRVELLTLTFTRIIEINWR